MIYLKIIDIKLKKKLVSQKIIEKSFEKKKSKLRNI